MEKLFLIFTLLTTVAFTATAQTDGKDNGNDFDRTGKIMIETGYTLFGSLIGGTGATIVFEDEVDLRSLTLNGGYFIKENLALRLEMRILSYGGTTFQLGGGAKYYINGQFPIEGTVGFIDYGITRFTGNFRIGYGLALASNINLEPTIGILMLGEENYVQIGLNFALFL